MLLGIDHLVLAALDPDAAALELEAKLGLTATGGGRHEALGTFNRLVWLGDSYLELIGVFDEGLARESWLGGPVLAALAGGGGLVTWAIAVDDLDEALRWAPPDGGLVGPTEGQRRRPDDRVVRWRTAHPAAPSPTAPFLIEHDPTAAEWTDDDRAARSEEQHAVGGRVRLVGLEVLAPSPAVAAGTLRRLLAAAVEPAGRGAVRVRFGPHEARFVAERPAASPARIDLLADIPLRTRVTRIGDCDIRLRGVPAALAPDPTAEAEPDAGAAPHPEPSTGV